MTNLREAAQSAFDALSVVEDYLRRNAPSPGAHLLAFKCKAVMQILRDELAQPEQEPEEEPVSVAWGKYRKLSGLVDSLGLAPDVEKLNVAYYAFHAAWEQAEAQHLQPATITGEAMKTISFDETKWRLVPVEPTESMIYNAGAAPPPPEVLELTEREVKEILQRRRMRERFANRPNTPATADFDLPAPPGLEDYQPKIEPSDEELFDQVLAEDDGTRIPVAEIDEWFLNATNSIQEYVAGYRKGFDDGTEATLATINKTINKITGTSNET